MNGALLLALVCAAAAAPAPEPIVLETSTAAFTLAWELALADGKAWRRPTRTPSVPWQLLPPAGVPVPSARIEAIKELVLPLARQFVAAGPLTQLSADGDNIVVVDEGRRVYYAKLGSLSWTDVWGPPALAAPLLLPADTISWAISHRALNGGECLRVTFIAPHIPSGSRNVYYAAYTYEGSVR